MVVLVRGLKGEFVPWHKLCNLLVRGLKQLLCLLSHTGSLVTVLGRFRHPIPTPVWFHGVLGLAPADLCHTLWWASELSGAELRSPGSTWALWSQTSVLPRKQLFCLQDLPGPQTQRN